MKKTKRAQTETRFLNEENRDRLRLKSTIGLIIPEHFGFMSYSALFFCNYNVCPTGFNNINNAKNIYSDWH